MDKEKKLTDASLSIWKPKRYETYYTLTDGYNYSTETLNAIYAELANLKRETQAYWYDASKRSAMDVD